MSCPVREMAARRPNAAALLFEGRSWTFAALESEVTAWTGRLASLGVRPNDRVAFLSANRPECIFLLFAARRLGATYVPLNARLTAPELAVQVEQLAPVHRIAQASLADRLPGATQLEALAKLPASAPAQDEAPPEVWVMIFTSGTTGRSKAVEITEANLRANARFSGENLGSDAEQRWLGNLPLFHVGGIAMVVRCALYGCALELEGRFDLDRTIAALHDHSITHASLVPQTLGRVLEAGPLRFSPKLRALLIGGGPSHPEVLAEARSRGLPVLQTYGLTEATSQVATERLADADGTTSGPPLPGLEVRIVDGEGRALPTGAEGDIEVRGLTVMRGYFQNPEATARTLQGGWLHTGDLGALDARGRLRVFARRSDLILSGGENVYPAELEQLLVGHPAVAEAAVVGVEDPRWGQVPVAVLVAKAQGVQPPDLDEWCRAQLAGFKVPRRWVWVNELPRNAGGKVDRAALRAMTRPAEPLRRADEARRR